MGLFMKKTKPDEELLAKGLRGHATVVHVAMSGMTTEMSMSRGKAEQVLRGDVTPIRRKVRLNVEVPGREAYELETKLNVPVMLSGKLVAGAGITVLVDPDDPKHLAVDWAAGVEQGSTAAMFADNPYAAAALQGAGYDPQLLAQQIDAARAQSAQAMAAWQAQAGAVPGQAPAGWPAIPPGVIPPGVVPSGVVIAPGVVPPGTVAPTEGAAPGAPPGSQPWPDATTNPVGPTSEEQPED